MGTERLAAAGGGVFLLLNSSSNLTRYARRNVKHAPKFGFVDHAEQRKAMMELGAWREPVGGVPLLGHNRVQQTLAKVARLAKVSGRRDRETFSLALTCHFVSILPRVSEYAVCLFPVPFVFPVARSQHRETSCADNVHSHTFN